MVVHYNTSILKSRSDEAELNEAANIVFFSRRLMMCGGIYPSFSPSRYDVNVNRGNNLGMNADATRLHVRCDIWPGFLNELYGFPLARMDSIIQSRAIGVHLRWNGHS
jgi:hypothetical protein